MMSARREADMRGELLLNEPMSRHTTWRAGGPAERYYRPADIADLAAFLATIPAGEPLFWLGLGSNLLVRDGGLRGTVIATSGCLDGIEQTGADRVRVEAGVACAKVARFCARAGFGGAEFLTGIPGTMGGALAMNAGCFGGETWPLVVEVETVDHRGVLHRRNASEYSVGYRSVRGPEGEWFVAATLQLAPGAGEEQLAHMRELLARRSATQPTGQANAGSVFRNPEGDHAGRLVEACGLKGYCIGKACVSDKHANFIINTGGAKAADIEALIAHVQTVVRERKGVTLQTEVHIVGEANHG